MQSVRVHACICIFRASSCSIMHSGMSFLLRDADTHSAYLLRYGDVPGCLAGWLAGWVSVTRRYFIKTAKPILKLFRPSSSPIILVSVDSCADTQFQGALNTQGWEKCRFSCDFRRKSPFISETVRDRPMVTMER